MACFENFRPVRLAPISIRGTGEPVLERIGEMGICRSALEGCPGFGFAGRTFGGRSD